jgi:hypothetical protein
MKKIKIIIIIFTILRFDPLSGQMNINCHVDFANDTAVSIYDFSKFNMTFYLSANLASESIKQIRRNSFFELKFSGFDWRPFKIYSIPPHIKYAPLYNGSVNSFLSFAYFILANDTLTTLWKNGDTPVQIRYKYEVLYSNAISTHYSNIDTLIIPRAKEHDIEGAIYLKNSEILTLDEMSSIDASINYEEYDQLVHIRDAFPNSLLSELARLLMVSYDASFLIEPIDEGYKVPPAVKAMIQSVYDSLSNSKSEYIRYKIKEYNDFMQAQPD